MNVQVKVCHVDASTVHVVTVGGRSKCFCLLQCLCVQAVASGIN
jgi:hypothetical protein